VQPWASVVVIVKLKFPDVVGVPDNAPDDNNVNPLGNAPPVTVKENGAVPPIAVAT
jgi:hypothetical protein